MKNKSFWASKITALSIGHPWIMLLTVSVLTIISILLSSGLEMRMNWSDTLPENNPVVKSYRNVQERFGDAGGLVIALEGDYASITSLADSLEPELKKLNNLYNVQGRMPIDYFRNHAFTLLKPDEFKRMLRIYSNPDMIGTFKGMNDDYEREYTENESNMRRDEVSIARSILGLHRTLEILQQNFSGRQKPEAISDAVDAMCLGEPWMLSLDREMLLILCEPVASQMDMNALLATAKEVEEFMDTVRPHYPEISINLTGLSRIGLDEMNSVGIYTIFLSLGALLLIYLLLARSFRGWLLPLTALAPLLIGVFWTTGLLYILFQSLNLFTAMIMIVLVGLGIDFSIHMISRYNEEMTLGTLFEDSIYRMIRETGVAVITGGLTTAAAFLTLLIGETKGVFEFGAAAGFGILLTLLAIFLTLPPLLVLRRKRQSKAQGDSNIGVKRPDLTGASRNMPILGRIASSGWRHPYLYLAVAIIIVAFSFWSKQHIEFEYDFLNLEPKGLKSVELQKEIPIRFGMSDHAAWVVANSIEESRALKEEFRKKSLVGDVSSISDYIPSPQRLEEYTPQLIRFREKLLSEDNGSRDVFSVNEFAIEIERLWDNLDLMSNLAYTSGLDRIVKVIDGITGTVTETGEVDKNAVLPGLLKTVQDGIDGDTAESLAEQWEVAMRGNLISMSNPVPVNLDDLPETIRRSHLPRKGEGFLVHVIPRQYLWSKAELDQFSEQTSSISAGVSGTEQLIVVMFESIIKDGRNAALLALLVIIGLVLIHFRGLIGLLSLVPLATGALAMVGLMYLLGEKYNYMNLIAVPIILGIGIDDGIHALHRFRNENKQGVDRIYSSFSHVGRAIFLTSVTTMIGFGSIAFYTMEGMASFGRALFMGVGACFIATIFVLPAVLRVFTKSK